MVINLWFLARQPASPWQTFCALLVAASSLCCYPNMKLMGLPSAELLHFLFVYVTWLLNLHVQLCATGVYVCKTLQANFRAAAIHVRTEENVLMMLWIILIIAPANSRFMVTTVKVSRVLISKWTYYGAVSVDVAVKWRDLSEINALSYTFKAIVGRYICASAYIHACKS